MAKIVEHHHEDFFAKITRKIELFIEKYLKILIISVTAVIVAVGAYLTVDFLLSKNEQNARSAFGKVWLVYKSAVSEQNLSGDALDKKLLEINEEFKKVIDDYPNSRASRESAYFVGNALYKLGKYSEAIDYFDRGLSKRKKYYVSFLCLLGKASSYEQLSQNDRAALVYSDILKTYGDAYVIPSVHFNLGQVYEKLNKLDKAHDEYSLIVDNFEWSSWKELAEKRLLLIKNFM